jgi:hypothetical protein
MVGSTGDYWLMWDALVVDRVTTQMVSPKLPILVTSLISGGEPVTLLLPSKYEKDSRYKVFATEILKTLIPEE